MAPRKFHYTPTPTGTSSKSQLWQAFVDVRLEEKGPEKASEDESNDATKEVTKKTSLWSRWVANPGEAGEGGWKPLSMTTPILAAIGTYSLLMAAAIEIVAQRSQAQGGLALSPSLEEIPQYAMLTYLYFPQAVAVLYSLVWSWVDLDVKRMQPWLELSKPGGATADDSLFLDYPVDFVAFVPFKAARRRHWPVFLAGTVMVIIFWAITPLQSAILGTDEVLVTRSVNVGSSSQLLPVEDQRRRLGPAVLNMGYAIGWLGKDYPSFMAPDYALLPFKIIDDPSPSPPKTNWTASTTQYTTELKCWPAQVESGAKYSTGSGAYNFLNGQGCNTTITIEGYSKYTMEYIGYWSSPYSDFGLASPSCPVTSNSTHQFLAIWASSPGRAPGESVELDITALFCQPYYYKQIVQVTVKADSLAPITPTIQTLGPKENVLETEFNSSAFEFLLANGMDEDPQPVRDKPFQTVIEQQALLEGMELRSPTANMVGFALAGQNKSTDLYKDPRVLHDAFSRAHKYLFSSAISQVLTNHSHVLNTTAVSSHKYVGIVASRPFCIAVESLLVLTAGLIFALLWILSSEQCCLRSNPSSISRMIEIFRNSPQLLQSFQSSDSTDDKVLRETFQGQNFRLVRDESRGVDGLSVVTAHGGSIECHNGKSHQPNAYYTPIRPFALKGRMGLAFFALLAVATLGLGLTYRRINEETGLPRASSSFEVNQFFENYLPTIFATFMEPFWVLLNRLLCILQPFMDLWSGKAPSDRTIDATYTSIPPQLVVWRAIKNKHFLLATVCATALLSNVLAVGLGALFNPTTTIAAYSQEARPTTSDRFNNDAVLDFGNLLLDSGLNTVLYTDHFHIAFWNYSSGNPLPPWVSPEFFFQPHQMLNTKDNPEDTYSILTRGYGARINCTSIPAVMVPRNSTDNRPKQNGCPDPLSNAIHSLREHSSYSFPGPVTGPSAVEYVGTEHASNKTTECDLTLTLGWARTADFKEDKRTTEASFALCTPSFETSIFNVTTNQAGRVLSYHPVDDKKHSLEEVGSKIEINTVLSDFQKQFAQPGNEWHNVTVINDWMSYLVLEKLGSRDIVDPKKPLPNVDDVIPHIQQVYSQTFAILLGLNQQLFGSPGAAPELIIGERFTKETKVFMDIPSFYVTMTILSLNLVVAAAFYAQASVSVLPRMPTSIGSLLAYVASSRVATTKHSMAPGLQCRTYSFGRYLGLDGSVHIGIEMDPHVVPIDPASLNQGNGIQSQFNRLLGRRRTYKSETWL